MYTLYEVRGNSIGKEDIVPRASSEYSYQILSFYPTPEQNKIYSNLLILLHCQFVIQPTYLTPTTPPAVFTLALDKAG